MNRNQIGNEIYDLGATELEVDYHQHNWRCVGRTIIEALLLASMFLVIVFFCAALQ